MQEPPGRTDAPLDMAADAPALGPHPAAVAALAALAADPTALGRAVPPDAPRLCAALSDLHGLPAACFVAGRGVEDLFAAVARAVVPAGARPGRSEATRAVGARSRDPRPGNAGSGPGGADAAVAVQVPSLAVPPAWLAALGLRPREVPYRGGLPALRMDTAALRAAFAQTGFAFLANPDAPVGNRLAAGEVEEVAAARPDGVLVLDESCIEYAGLRHSLLPHAPRLGNLVVLRTLGQAHGLPGLRVAYAVAHPDLAARLRAAQAPLLDALSEAVAVAALDDPAWTDGAVRAVRGERERLLAALPRLGLRPAPGEGPWVVAEPPVDPAALRASLLRHGVACRTFPGVPLLGRAVRFTVGDPAATDRLLAVLPSALADAGATPA